MRRSCTSKPGDDPAGVQRSSASPRTSHASPSSSAKAPSGSPASAVGACRRRAPPGATRSACRRVSIAFGPSGCRSRQSATNRGSPRAGTRRTVGGRRPARSPRRGRTARCSGRHHQAGAAAFAELQPAGDPAAAVEPTAELSVGVVQAAAVGVPSPRPGSATISPSGVARLRSGLTPGAARRSSDPHVADHTTSMRSRLPAASATWRMWVSLEVTTGSPPRRIAPSTTVTSTTSGMRERPSNTLRLGGPARRSSARCRILRAAERGLSVAIPLAMLRRPPAPARRESPPRPGIPRAAPTCAGRCAPRRPARRCRR